MMMMMMILFRLGAMLQNAVRHRDEERREFSVRRLFTNDDDYNDNNDELWYDGLMNDVKAAEGDDDVIDERECKLSIYEEEPLISMASSDSVLSTDDDDGDDDDDDGDDHQVGVDHRSVTVVYGSSFIYPDLLMIRVLLKMIWNLLEVKDGFYHAEYRKMIASWIVTVEVGALFINAGSVVDNVIVDDMKVKKGKKVDINRRRGYDDDMNDAHSGSSSSHTHSHNTHKGDTNNNHDQNNHVKRGIKLSRIAREDSVIMLYYNLLSSTTTTTTPSTTHTDDGI